MLGLVAYKLVFLTYSALYYFCHISFDNYQTKFIVSRAFASVWLNHHALLAT